MLQVLLTPTHLAIVMEYAAGGELFDRICSAGRFSEDEVFNDNMVFWMSNEIVFIPILHELAFEISILFLEAFK